MAQTLSYKQVKTKKRHLCFSCLRYFPLNTLMYKWSCIYEGDFNYGYTCSTCDELHELSGENEFEEGFVREGLDKNQTPEQLLEKIKHERTNKNEL